MFKSISRISRSPWKRKQTDSLLLLEWKRTGEKSFQFSSVEFHSSVGCSNKPLLLTDGWDLANALKPPKQLIQIATMVLGNTPLVCERKSSTSTLRKSVEDTTEVHFRAQTEWQHFLKLCVLVAFFCLLCTFSWLCNLLLYKPKTIHSVVSVSLNPYWIQHFLNITTAVAILLPFSFYCFLCIKDGTKLLDCSLSVRCWFFKRPIIIFSFRYC